MIKFVEAVLLFSEDAEGTAKFYEEKVGLKKTLEAEMGDEGANAISFEFGSGANLYIIDHSKVKGKNSQPERMMFNLEVDDIEKEFERFKEAGVKVVADIYHVEDFGYISTFEDPDGNYFQLVKTRE